MDIAEFFTSLYTWMVDFVTVKLPDYILTNLTLIAQILFLFVLAYVGGKLAKAITVKLLSVMGFKKITIRSWTDDILKAVGYRGTIVSLIGDLVKWFIYILVLGIIIELLGFPGLVNVFNQIAGFVPRFIVSILVIVVGFLIADFLGRIFEEAGRRFFSDETIAIFSGAIIKYSIALVSIIMSLAFIGMDTLSLNILFAILLASVMFTLILGLKDVVPNFTSGINLKKTLRPGERIRVAGHSGILERVDPLSVTLRNGSKRITIPNSLLAKNPIEILEKNTKH